MKATPIRAPNNTQAALPGPECLGTIQKIRVVYGGFDMERFRPADSDAQRRAWGLEPNHYALGVGGYSVPRGKGQPEFLQAAAKYIPGSQRRCFLKSSAGWKYEIQPGNKLRLRIR